MGIGLHMDTKLIFTERDEEIAGIFNEVGLKVNVSRVLVMFLTYSNINSRDIERYTDLRQPEVSIAINDLVNRRWIEVTKHITVNKGRPIKVYNLSLSPDEIIDQIEGSINKEYNQLKASVERVRELVKEARVRE